jgi:hypothetical protein
MRTFELPPKERARYQFAIAWALGFVALGLALMKIGIEQGAFDLPVVIVGLVVLAMFVWANLLPVLSSAARVFLHDDGIEATTTYGRRFFVAWSELERLNLRPVAIGRRRAELRLIDRKGRARVMVTGHIANFDHLVRQIEERLGGIDGAPQEVAAPDERGMGWRQRDQVHTTTAPQGASRALAAALVRANYVNVRAADDKVRASSGWLEVYLTLRPVRDGSVVEVSTRDGPAPRMYWVVSFVLLLVAGIGWFVVSGQPLMLLGLVGFQLISLVLVQRVARAQANTLVRAVRRALPS